MQMISYLVSDQLEGVCCRTHDMDIVQTKSFCPIAEPGQWAMLQLTSQDT